MTIWLATNLPFVNSGWANLLASWTFSHPRNHFPKTWRRFFPITFHHSHMCWLLKFKSSRLLGISNSSIPSYFGLAACYTDVLSLRRQNGTKNISGFNAQQKKFFFYQHILSLHILNNYLILQIDHSEPTNSDSLIKLWLWISADSGTIIE